MLQTAVLDRRIRGADAVASSTYLVVGVLACALLCVPRSARAQGSAPLPVEVGAGVVKPIHVGSLARWWSPAPGMELSLLFPLGPGAVRLAAELSRVRALEEGLPDYRALFPSVQWGLAGNAPGGTRWYLGAGMGAYWTAFQGVGENGTEMEIGVSGTALLRRGIVRGWLLGGGVEGRRILTARPLDQLSLFLEVGRRWIAPRWMAGALGRTEGAPEQAADSMDSDPAPDAASPLSRPAGTREARAGDPAALRRNGVLRLSEVLRALPAWDVASLDLRTVVAVPDGLSTLGDGGVEVLVDGIPVPLGMLGSLALDRLPLPLDGLAYVEAWTTPGLRFGSFRDGAGLNLRTAAPERNGVQLRVQGLAEQPTGDPGPYLFTDSAARNLDKLGTGYSLAGAWRAGGLSGSLGYAYRSDLVTGPGLGERTFAVRDPGVYPVVRTLAPWASLRIERAGAHALRLGHSRRTDFFFLPALGVEVPARLALWHAGASGELPLGDALRLSYQAWGARNALEKEGSAPGLDFDLRAAQRGLVGSLTWKPAWSVSLAGGVEAETHDSRWLASRLERATQRASLGLETPPARIVGSGEVELRRARGELGIAGSLGGTLALGGGAHAGATLWVSDAGRTRAAGFWELHELGYGFLAEAGVEVEERGVEDARIESGVELELRRLPVGRDVLVGFRGRLNRSRGLGIALPAFGLEGSLPFHEGPVAFTRSAGGTVVVLGTELNWRPRAALELRSDYRWLRVTEGDADFLSSRRVLPAHRAVQSLLWIPRGDLSLSLRAEARSATRWDAYAPAGRERLAGGVTVDLGLAKELWGGRATVDGRIGDLLDQGVALHPLGTAPGLSVAVRGSLKVGG